MPPRCLDLTRLVSRTGQGPLTGVDRVELAYLRALLARPEPLFALNRTATGFALLDQPGAAALLARITGVTPWGRPDVAAHLSRRLSLPRRRAEADLRRLAIARCLRPGLGRMLTRHLPPGTTYLNTGHSNLADPVMRALRSVPDVRIAVLVHDTIPLDFPQFQRPGTPKVFARKMRVVSRHADLVICNSRQTQSDVARHFTGFGRLPDTLVAHLGIDPPQPDPGALPADLDLSRPYFVTVGTIEPRKNHALLLDVWDHLAQIRAPRDMPLLVIAGRRGWNNDALFARLDASPLKGRAVIELADLTDSALAALVQGARALLFPSLAEGFGLPPSEAQALGTPVICAPLPVYRETLGDKVVYAAASDMYPWAAEIERHMSNEQTRQGAGRAEPLTWGSHFNQVFTTI